MWRGLNRLRPRLWDMQRLLDLTFDELQALLVSWDEPAFRAGQVWKWLYARQATGPEEMTDLPQGLRSRLAAETTVGLLQPAVATASRDRLAHKVLFRLLDGQTIESVLMLYDERRTLCISTQAGCGMGCTFCATGLGGLARNLTSGEITSQVLYFARWLRQPTGVEGHPLPLALPSQVTNVVLMGMGEPLANYGPVWQALSVLTDGRGFGLGARHFTLSTVGLVPMIDRMAEEPLQVNLAVSLHAPFDELRNQLVPINRRYPLGALLGACRRYVARTHRRITFEYALMQGINDQRRHAEGLAQLLKGLLCHVNLIPLNPVAGSPFQPSTRLDTQVFVAVLRAAGIPATLRLRRGLEINAGCGQLRQQVQHLAGVV